MADDGEKEEGQGLSLCSDLKHRVRVIHVPEYMVLDACLMRFRRIDQDGEPEAVTLERIAINGGMPKDAEVVGVHHDFRLRSFVFMVQSSEFPPVPQGDLVPRLDENAVTVRFDVRASAVKNAIHWVRGHPAHEATKGEVVDG